MPRKFKQARQISKLKMAKATAKLGISQPTLSAWEGERKSPSSDGLEHMADLYGVTTDYLIGRRAVIRKKTVSFRMSMGTAVLSGHLPGQMAGLQRRNEA